MISIQLQNTVKHFLKSLHVIFNTNSVEENQKVISNGEFKHKNIIYHFLKACMQLIFDAKSIGKIQNMILNILNFLFVEMASATVKKNAE